MFWTEFGIIDKERKSCFLIMAARKEAQAERRIREETVLGIPCGGWVICLHVPCRCSTGSSDVFGLLVVVGGADGVPFNLDLKANSPPFISFFATPLRHTLPYT